MASPRSITCTPTPSSKNAEFGEGRDIEEPNLIAEILRELGQDASAILERAQSEETKTRLREQTDEAHRLGRCGAPSFVTPSGELFWGNDRLEAALDWTKR